jgi:hypothetical protein
MKEQNIHSLLLEVEKELLSNWQKSGFDLLQFPSLAREQLEKKSFENFDVKEFLNYVIKSHHHLDIHHYDLNFTENIHFTLFRNPYFFIDIYSWMEHTEIHSHNFSGCFCILQGDFSQTSYDFKKNREGNNWALGVLNLVKREKLSIGSIHEIVEGEKFIHQVFHFNNPCVSLCIRTPDTKRDYLSYFYPGLRLGRTSFKRPDFLRMKALNQLILVSKEFPVLLAKEMIASLEISPLVYDYMSGHSFFKLKGESLLELEKLIEQRIEEELGVNISQMRRQNQIHIRKLELCEI